MFLSGCVSMAFANLRKQRLEDWLNERKGRATAQEMIRDLGDPTGRMDKDFGYALRWDTYQHRSLKVTQPMTGPLTGQKIMTTSDLGSTRGCEFICFFDKDMDIMREFVIQNCQ